MLLLITSQDSSSHSDGRVSCRTGHTARLTKNVTCWAGMVNTTREPTGNGSFHSGLECALAMDGKNVCRDRWYIKLSCSGGSGNNNYHHISITRCKPNKKGKTFSRIPLAGHRLLLVAPCQNGIRFIVRPSLKIVKRQQHKHTRKKSKKNIQNGRCL
jgi:hypothetical protein